MDPDDTLVDGQPDTADVTDPAAVAAAAEAVEAAEAAAKEPAKTPIPAPKWAMERINEETNRRQAESERATAAERRAADLEAMLARMQKGEKSGQEPPLAKQPAQQGDAQFNAAVDRAAAQRRMVESRSEIIQNGYAAFGPARFDEIANLLVAAGGGNDDFLADVLAVDRPNAHKTLEKIIADPDNLVRLTKMDSRQRIAELTRMTIATNAAPPVPEPPRAPPKPASKAPPPKPVIDPAASNPDNWMDDNASDEDFYAGLKSSEKWRGLVA